MKCLLIHKEFFLYFAGYEENKVKSNFNLIVEETNIKKIEIW